METKNKTGCAILGCGGCGLLIAAVLAIFFLLQVFPFFGPGIFSELFGSRSGDDDMGDIFKTAPARNYPFHEPGAAAKNRKIDCRDLYWYSRGTDKSKKIYCANLYGVSEMDIAAELSQKKNDRIILYGEKIFFDVGTGQTGLDPRNIIETARFTDQITLPKMMEIYGQADFSYIGAAVAPYPAVHLMLQSSAEINEGHENKAGGYALGYFENTTDLAELVLPKLPKKAYTRSGGSDRITISYAWPENCLVSQGILHELNHNFSEIKMTPDEDYYFILPNWFEEQVANVVYSIFPEYVCGKGTITGYESEIGGVSGRKNLIEFNSVMPPANLYGNDPEWFKDDCQKAVIVSWYRFIGKGDFVGQFRRYATAMRQATKNKKLRKDSELASFIAGLDGTAETREFLRENGCRI